MKYHIQKVNANRSSFFYFDNCKPGTVIRFGYGYGKNLDSNEKKIVKILTTVYTLKKAL